MFFNHINNRNLCGRPILEDKVIWERNQLAKRKVPGINGIPSELIKLEPRGGMTKIYTKNIDHL